MGILTRMYPNEMLRIAQTAIDKYRAGAPAAQVGQYVTEQRQALMLDNLWLASVAPDDRISAYIDVRVSVIGALAKEDSAACAAAWRGGASPPQQRLAAQISQLTIGQLQLMEAGRATPARHDDPTNGDIAAFMDAVKAHGLNDAEAGTLLTGDFGGRSAADQCRIGLAMAQALQSLSPIQRVRLEASFLRTAGKRPTHVAPEERIRAEWSKDPVLGAAMMRLAADMPDDANHLIAAMVDREKAGDFSGESDAFDQGLKDIFSRNLDAITGASDERLAAIGVVLHDLMAAYNAADPHCGLDPTPTHADSPDMDDAAVRLKRAVIVAMLDGRQAKAAGAPMLARAVTQPDAKLMVTRLRAFSGDDVAAANGLLHGDVKSLPVADRCRSHVVNMTAINSLPPGARSDYVADFLQRMYPPPTK
jgi:hypothetical protein